MSFASNLSKNQAQATVAKLFSNILPEANHSGRDYGSKKKQPKVSATELLAQQFHHSEGKEEQQQDLKRKKRALAAKVRKARENEKKFKKHVKYNIIKNHRDHTEEEKKYLNKLQRKNVNQLLKVAEVDDMEVGEEIDDLMHTLAEEGKIVRKKQKRTNEDREFMHSLKANQDEIDKRHKLDAFNKRVEEGVLAVPSLTPGLAPVDYEESDEE